MHITSDVIVASISDEHVVVLSLWKVTELLLVELDGVSG